MGSFRCHILFTFLWGFYPLTDVFSQPSTVEVYDYSYVTRGGKTIQESTTIYVTDDPHEVFNGYRWINGKYFIIAIISRKGKFILKTFNEEGRVKKGKYTEYSVYQYYLLILYTLYFHFISHTHIAYPGGHYITDTGAISVEGFNASMPYNLQVLPGDYVLKRGEGYWILMPFDTTWTVDW